MTEEVEHEITFLLDQEKQKLENDIIERHDPSGNQMPVEIGHSIDDIRKEKPVIEKPSKRTKDDIIEDFMRLQESSGNICYKSHQLKRKTRQELLKLMAEYSSNVLLNQTPTKSVTFESSSNDAPPFEKPVLSNGEPPNPIQSLDPTQMNMIADGLFNMNLALVGTLETGSIYLKDRTGDIALLENWSKKIVDKREKFLEVFKQIYAQHKMELDKYMSPVVLYSVLMTQSAAEAIYQNVQEKKNKSLQK